MLQFLQTGRMLFVLGMVCVLGIISKLVTGSLYKSLIKETGNMALTKNKDLKALKQKTENLFLISYGIRNISVYIEKQIYGFRFMKMSLDTWDNLSIQAMILSFFLGGLSAFGAYWYRCDSYYIVLYGAMGILSALLLFLVDNGANISLKRQQLEDCLIDYVENSPHFYKSVDKSQETTIAAVTQKQKLREIGRRNAGADDEAAAGGETGLAAGTEKSGERGGRFHIEKNGFQAETEKAGNAQGERQGGRFSVLSKKKENMREPSETIRTRDGGNDAELLKSIEQLRESLEQIAAGREQERPESKQLRQAEKPAAERALKELRPEDIKLLGEILKEYMT